MDSILIESIEKNLEVTLLSRNNSIRTVDHGSGDFISIKNKAAIVYYKILYGTE